MNMQVGIGGTPARKQAHQNRRHILGLLRRGPMRKSELLKALPKIGKHAMDRHLQVLRSAGRVRCPRFGVWAVTNLQYSPADAHAMEDALRVLWKPAKRAGRLPPNKMPAVNDISRIEIAEKKRLRILSLCTNDWQEKVAIVRKLDINEDAARSSIDCMIRDGRLEGRKVRNKVQVRLPRGERS